MMIGLLVLLGAAGIFAWKLFDGLRSGTFHDRGGPVNRTNAPVLYWLSAACQCALLGLASWGLMMVALRL